MNSPLKRFQRRWELTTLLGASASIIAASFATAGRSGVGGIEVSALAISGMVAGYVVLPHLPAFFRSKGFQNVALALALFIPWWMADPRGAGQGQTPELVIGLLDGLRNIVAVSAAYCRDLTQRRRAVLVGLAPVVAAFALSGSAPVTVASLVYVAVLAYWLTLGDSERSLSFTRRDPLRNALSWGAVAAACICFLLSVLAYPDEIKTAQRTMARFAGEEQKRRTSAADATNLEEDEALNEIADRALGQAKKVVKDKDGEDSQKDREFSIRRDAATQQAIEQLFRVRSEQAVHIPMTTYGKFDGSEWRPDRRVDASMRSGRIMDQGAWVQSLNREAVSLGPIAAQLDLSSEDFLEQARRMLSQQLVQSDGGVMQPSFKGIDPDRLEELLRSGPNLEADGDYLFTPYDSLESIQGDFAANPKLAQMAMQMMLSGSFSEDRIERLVRAWRRGRSTPPLPPELAQLVNTWRKDAEPGWGEITAIVDGLRGHCAYDPAVPAQAEGDAIKHFLTGSRRGPDYMFASSAVVLLRSLGYPTRMVGGFVAKPSRYNWITGTTAIREDDLHYWAQVKSPVSGVSWIDIEPTPGFELAPASKPPGNIFLRFVAWVKTRSLAQQVTAATLFVLAALSWLFSRRLRLMGEYLAWRLAALGAKTPQGAQRLVQSTWRLLDHRARYAGAPRPPHRTPTKHFAPILRHDGPASSALSTFAPLAELTTFGPDGSASPPAVRQAAQALVEAAKPRQLRQGSLQETAAP